MASNNETTISINVTARSGDNYAGSFTVKKRLSYRDRLRQDEIRRSLLGVMPAGATDDSILDSLAFAELHVHIINSPSWWKENSNGLDLMDPEPVREIHKKIMEMRAELNGDLTKQAEEAKAVLTEEIKK